MNDIRCDCLIDLPSNHGAGKIVVTETYEGQPVEITLYGIGSNDTQYCSARDGRCIHPDFNKASGGTCPIFDPPIHESYAMDIGTY